MRNRYINLASWTITLLVTMAAVVGICALLSGCASTGEVRYETIEVKIPVPVPPVPIDLPEKPVWESPECTDDWQRCLQMIVRDLINAWAHVEELRHVIDSHNEAIPSPPVVQ